MPPKSQQRQSTGKTAPVSGTMSAVFTYEINSDDGTLKRGPIVAWKGDQPTTQTRTATLIDFESYMTTADPRGPIAYANAAKGFCAQSDTAKSWSCGEYGEPDPDTDEATGWQVKLGVTEKE